MVMFCFSIESRIEGCELLYMPPSAFGDRRHHVYHYPVTDTTKVNHGLQIYAIRANKISCWGNSPRAEDSAQA